MYVILVNPDDSLYGSKKERLMQRQKLVNKIVFISDPIYNGIDMTNATVMLEYLLPVSKRYMTEILTLSKKRYKDCFLQYELPLDTKFSSEAGEVQLQLTFAKTELDEYGNDIQRVRKTSPTTITITPITAWSDIIPDSALEGLDQRLIAMNAQIQALDDYMNVIESNKADNIVYDKIKETLQLSSNGVKIGDKVSVKDMLSDGFPIVDLNSIDGSDSDTVEPEDDNVVEF